MSTLPFTGDRSRPLRRRPLRRRPPRRGSHGPLLLPLVVFAAVAFMAFVYIGYVLWPRWPGPPVGPDAPALPITVAGVTFNVPPAAIRVPVQRRPGAQERVDLAFVWPSLEPPYPDAKPVPPAPGTAPAPTIERIFVTIAGAGDTLAPHERVLNIYPRYAAAETAPGPGGLTLLAFREGTPYQGEDLIYDADAPGFLVRCTRNGAGPTPGTCLYERRIEAADIVVRFPRDWLGDWRAVAEKITRLIASLRPSR
jgi:hypothetical protein